MPSNNFEHVIHKHSSVVTNGNPKLPTTSQIEYGEIAVNYAKDHETISLKNSNNEIVTFSTDEAIKKIINEDAYVISNSLNNLNSRVGYAESGISDLRTTVSGKQNALSNASVLSGISSSDISNWNSKTDNVGTVTGVKMNGTTNNPTSGVVDLGTVVTSETTLSKGTTSGSGNAVTDISVSGHQITLTKGSTFLTSHQSIKTINNTSLVGTGDLTINGLPTVTSADNGKILMVVNGAWALVSPTMIYTGSGTPSSAQGNEGDIYLQTN